MTSTTYKTRNTMCMLAVAVVAAMCVSSPAFAAADNSADAIGAVLNSRASGSKRMYAVAAASVAKAAEEGKPLQQFVVAILSKDKNVPLVLQISDETRRKYLASSKPKIKKMAEKKNNSLAWYLLTIEGDDHKMLEKAASFGNVQALNTLGMMRFDKAFDDPSADSAALLKEAFKFFKKAADKDDANGYNNLGICYQNGQGCTKDEKAAFDCFRKAADLNHPEAVNNLGRFYREGIVVDQDFAKAAECFSRSAKMGCEVGQINYAIALLRGEGVARNERRAVELIESMATGGSAEAMEVMSLCYEQGQGVERDAWKSMVWSIRSKAARGDKASQKWLEANGFVK